MVVEEVISKLDQVEHVPKRITYNSLLKTLRTVTAVTPGLLQQEAGKKNQSKPYKKLYDGLIFSDR